jgi:hypothetical protein
MNKLSKQERNSQNHKNFNSKNQIKIIFKLIKILPTQMFSILLKYKQSFKSNTLIANKLICF